ncbi:hypothetical protein GGF46_002192 [Coemansia sp. RSA 552]|nr:hypothetical protein GGF46_002192 [Coemansia sp. RSA 552]
MPRPARKSVRKTPADEAKENSPASTSAPSAPSPSAPSPSASSPRYGRRTGRSSLSHRRLSLTPQANRVFEGLIEGLSPVKRGLPEEADAGLNLSPVGVQFGENLSPVGAVFGENLSPVGAVFGENLSPNLSPVGAVFGELPSEGEEQEEDSASEDFDIDALLLRTAKSRKAVPAKSQKSQRAAAKSQKAAAKSQKAAAKPPKVLAGGGVQRRRSTRVAAKRKAVISGSSDESDAADVYRPKRRAVGRGAAKKRGRAAGVEWTADAGVAQYFEDIDGYTLAEEKV